MIAIVVGIMITPTLFCYCACRNNTSVREDVANGTIIFQVKAVDADFGNNSMITYHLLPAEYSGKFSIDASSGNITLAGELDYENTTEVILRIQATDGKFVSNTTLLINVEDVNDNYPYFNESSYSVIVPENIPIGYVVIRVAAEDRDSGSNGKLTYSLVQDASDTDTPLTETFSINSTNGAITTLKKIKLNNTAQVTYKFVVQVIDHGNPSLKSDANTFITVKDINDSPPEFKQCQNFTVRTPDEAKSTILRVSATDADYGSNANITYCYAILKTEFCRNKFENDDQIPNLETIQWDSHYIVNISATDGIHTVFCVLDLHVEKKHEEIGAEVQTGEQFLLNSGKNELIAYNYILKNRTSEF